MTPKETVAKAVEVGQTKASLSVGKMLLLGIFAGALIALAGVGATLGNVYAGKLAGACIFPIGLIMVVITGSELFTGNNLMIIAALKGQIKWRALFKNWFIVFIGNFIGALIVAVTAVYSGVLDSAAEAVINTAELKTNLSFLEALLRGVLCNVLVCLAIFMAFSAKTVSGKILAIFGPIMLFVLCGFEHSVANMYYGPAGIFMAIKNEIGASLNMDAFLINNLLPVTIGNIIGGAGLIGCGFFLAYPHQDQPKAK